MMLAAIILNRYYWRTIMQFDGVIFPGQGTQHLGMGKDFYELYSDAQHIFDTATNTLNFNVYETCQNDEEKLNNTEYTQPCVLTTSIAMYQVLKNHHNLDAKVFAGHSLGEYAALVAAKVIPFDIALKIVSYRGKLMQQALAPHKEGSMVAIIAESLPLQQIQDICLACNVDIANDNSSQQIVLSGHTEDVKAAILLIEKTGNASNNMRTVYLNVKAPFHSRYMQKIEEPFREYLVEFKKHFNHNYLDCVISNYTGNFYTKDSDLIDCLTKQLSGSVKWRQNMNNFIKKARNILEIGPAAPLKGFFKSININVQAITNVRTLNKMLVVEA